MHFWQAMQPAVHFFLVLAPFSVFLQAMYTGKDAFSIEISFLGQALIHKPHPVQRFGIIRASPFEIQTALEGHTVWQSP